MTGMHALWRVAAVSVVVLGGGMASGQCEPVWSDVFTPGEFDGSVMSAAIFDGGLGPGLVVGGAFRGADGLPGTSLRRWDGVEWSDFGSFPYSYGNSSMLLRAANEADPPRFLATQGVLSGSGPITVHVYVGEWSTTSFDVEDARVIGLLHGPSSAPWEIYLCGRFDLGGDLDSMVMRWDGTRWEPLDHSDDPYVTNIVWFDDGSGEALYASVSRDIDGVPVRGVARWDGANWSEVGGGCPAYWPRLVVHDDGSGAALWGIGSDMLVKWDGVAWSSFPIGPREHTVAGFASADLGDGPQLVWAESDFVSSTLWRWNGVEAEQIGGQIGGHTVPVIADRDGAFGGGVIIGGSFKEAGGVPACNLAGYRAGTWRAVGSENVGNGARARDIVWVGSDGGPLLGNRLFVSTYSAGGRWARGAATWDGSEWTGIGTLEATRYPGMLAAGDLGGGARVFTWNGAELVTWDGADWSVLGAADIGGIPTLNFGAIDGEEPRAYLAGSFDTIDGVRFNSIASLDLQGWHRVGGGLPSGSGTTTVWALGFHDDGSGTALYASGWFHDLYPSLRDGIVRWDGIAWSRVGPALFGLYENAEAFCYADLGEGPRLFAGGNFDGIDGDLGNIIVWDGQEWTRVGDGLPPVYALARVEIDGVAHIAAAVWAPSDGAAHERVYLWDCLSWRPFGAVANGSVAAITQAPGDRNAVYLAGSFTEMGGIPSEGIARWGCECAADFNGDGMADTRDFIAFLSAWAAGSDTADFDDNGLIDTRDFIAFLNAWSAGC